MKILSFTHILLTPHLKLGLLMMTSQININL